jgi:O-antigen/teichoic acid export membrane protein
VKALKKLAGETAVYGISTVLGRFVNFLLVPFYTRVFVPDEYGVVTELYAYITFLLVIYTYGMETAFFRFASQDNKPRNIFTVSFLSLTGSSVLLTGIILLTSPLIAHSLGYGSLPELIKLTGLILLFDTLAVIPFAYLRFQQKPVRFSLLKLLHILFNIGFNLFFLLLLPWMFANAVMPSFTDVVYDPEIGPGYVFVSNLLASIMILPFLYREFRDLQFNFDVALWKKMLAFGLPLVVVGLAGMINEVSDRIMLKHLLPYPEDQRMYYLGIYGACYKLSIFMTLGIQAFRFAAEPFFFRESVNPDAPETYAQVMNFFVAAGTVVFLGISLYLDVIILIIDEAYHEGAHIVPVLLMANLFLGIFYNASVWYKLTGKTMAGAMISLTGAFITISGNFLLIPVIGYTGAAITTLACYSLMSVFSLFWGKKHYPVPYDFRFMVLSILAVIFVYVITEQIVAITNIGDVVAYSIRTAVLLAYISAMGWVMKLGRKTVG